MTRAGNGSSSPRGAGRRRRAPGGSIPARSSSMSARNWTTSPRPRARAGAGLGETGVASTSGALRRAGATLATADTAVPSELDDETCALLERYVAACEGYDIDRLTEFLHGAAVQSMPTYSLWLQGR